MFCKYCGKEMEAGTVICPHCKHEAEALSGGTGFWDLKQDLEAAAAPRRSAPETREAAPSAPPARPAPAETPEKPESPKKKKSSGAPVLLTVLTGVLAVLTALLAVLCFRLSGKISALNADVAQLKDRLGAAERRLEETPEPSAEVQFSPADQVTEVPPAVSQTPELPPAEPEDEETEAPAVPSTEPSAAAEPVLDSDAEITVTLDLNDSAQLVITYHTDLNAELDWQYGELSAVPTADELTVTYVYSTDLAEEIYYRYTDGLGMVHVSPPFCPLRDLFALEYDESRDALRAYTDAAIAPDALAAFTPVWTLRSADGDRALSDGEGPESSIGGDTVYRLPLADLEASGDYTVQFSLHHDSYYESPIAQAVWTPLGSGSSAASGSGDGR